MGCMENVALCLNWNNKKGLMKGTLLLPGGTKKPRANKKPYFWLLNELSNKKVPINILETGICRSHRILA